MWSAIMLMLEAPHSAARLRVSARRRNDGAGFPGAHLNSRYACEIGISCIFRRGLQERRQPS